MKRLHFSSFRQRLNAAFLAVSLVPMLLCSGLLLQIFRLRMTSNAQQTAQQQLSASCEALDTLHSGFLQTAASLQHNPLVAQALFDAEAEDTAVYSQLFDALLPCLLDEEEEVQQASNAACEDLMANVGVLQGDDD